MIGGKSRILIPGLTRNCCPSSSVVEDHTGSVVLRLHSDPDSGNYETEMSSAGGEVVGHCLREEHDRTGYILSNTNGNYFSF